MTVGREPVRQRQAADAGTDDEDVHDTPFTTIVVLRILSYTGRVPPPNDRRRAQIADTAIALLVEAGVHGVTHRAIDARAALPAGTASNYFRSREALLVVVTRRIAELHRADMAEAAAAHVAQGDPVRRTVELIAASLHHAATAQRGRYLAIFELRLESLRRPALAAALDELTNAIAAFTVGHHAGCAWRYRPRPYHS